MRFQMNTDHWFDRLNKAFVGELDRRHLLRVAGVLSALPLIGVPATPVSAAEKPGRCAKAKALCARHFKSKLQRQRCEEKCGRCRVRAKFCVAGPDLAHPDVKKHATCCHASQKCCQNTLKCCPEAAECCPASHVKARKFPCCGAGKKCCLDAADGCCLSSEYCCPGVGCVADRQACDCATGGECPEAPCPDGQPRCNGVCCTLHPTGRRTRCFGGTTCCQEDYVEPFWCPGTTPNPTLICVPDASIVCCDGYSYNVGTIDPTIYVCCGRGSNASGRIQLASIGCGPQLEQYPPLATHTYRQG
jgi:hypothetical protein